MSSFSKGKFMPGEIVFARWQGSDEFEIVEELFGATIPHYKCKTWVAKKYEYWVIPQIHLSRKEISLMIREPNRKQLNLLEP